MSNQGYNLSCTRDNMNSIQTRIFQSAKTLCAEGIHVEHNRAKIKPRVIHDSLNNASKALDEYIIEKGSTIGKNDLEKVAGRIAHSADKFDKVEEDSIEVPLMPKGKDSSDDTDIRGLLVQLKKHIEKKDLTETARDISLLATKIAEAARNANHKKNGKDEVSDLTKRLAKLTVRPKDLR